MDPAKKFMAPRQIRMIFVLSLFLLAGLVWSTPVSAETVGAGISTGPAKACPSPGCTCMPEGQAEALGYVRCSASETPCFNDSFNRPLYCFGPPGDTCGSSGCNATGPGSQAPDGAGSERFTLVITMQETVAADASCTGTGGDVCALPEAAPVTPAPSPAAANAFSAVLDFFRSLFGMG